MIDVAGAGGTSWSEVERFRQTEERGRRIAAVFAGWGTPTTEAIKAVRTALPDITIIGSGGVRTGVHVATALALGADLAGSAAPHLFGAVGSEGVPGVVDGLHAMIDELRIAMFCTGAANVQTLRQTPLEYV